MTLTALAVAIACVVTIQPVMAGDDSLVLLSHDDVVVTKQDFMQYVDAKIPADKQHQVLAQQGNIRTLISQLYVIRTLATQARADGLPKRSTVAWKLDFAADRTLTQAYLDSKVAAALSETDWETLAKDKYENNPQAYKTKEQVHAAHILISTADRGEQAAKKRAQMVYQKLREGGDFAALAKEYSDGPTGDKGGDLGYFGKGRMAPAFEQAAFALHKAGELTEPVKTRFGYHIIKLLERKSAKVHPFSEVKDKIIAGLQTERRKRVRGREISKVRQAEGIDIDQEAVSALEEEFSSGESQ